jgi:hypothetical protein
MNKKGLGSLVTLMLGVLACSPVIAISWKELLVIGIVIAVLLGPPFYRFFRNMEEFWKYKKKD